MENKLEVQNIKSLMSNDAVKAKFTEIMGKNASAFISSVVTLSTTTQLSECEPKSILSCAIVAATLGLQINPGLGQAAIIPYNSKNGKVAQFQIMKNGYVQLAYRTGQFKTINVTKVYDGEIKSYNILTGEIDLSGKRKDGAAVIGYCAYFRLVNNAEKAIYMTVSEIHQHAKTYSKSYSYSSGVWQTNFNSMAEKTVLKMLLKNWAPLSIDMVNVNTAVLADQAEIRSNDDGLDFTEYSFIDNENDEVEEPAKIENTLKVSESIEAELKSKSKVKEPKLPLD